jgi:hypothetical protein
MFLYLTHSLNYNHAFNGRKHEKAKGLGWETWPGTATLLASYCLLEDCFSKNKLLWLSLGGFGERKVWVCVGLLFAGWMIQVLWSCESERRLVVFFFFFFIKDCYWREEDLTAMDVAAGKRGCRSMLCCEERLVVEALRWFFCALDVDLWLLMLMATSGGRHWWWLLRKNNFGWWPTVRGGQLQ